MEEIVQVKKTELEALKESRREAIQKLNEVIARDGKIFKQVQIITSMLMDKQGNFDSGNVMNLVMNPSNLKKLDTPEFKEAFQFIINYKEEA